MKAPAALPAATATIAAALAAHYAEL